MTKDKRIETLDPVEVETPSTTNRFVSGQRMYVGPSLSTPTHLQHRVVFSGGLPANIQKLVEKDEELAACFLPLSEAGKALRELDKMSLSLGQGVYAKRYNSIQKRYKESTS